VVVEKNGPITERFFDKHYKLLISTTDAPLTNAAKSCHAILDWVVENLPKK
jgi:hypothetical protein